MGNRYRYLDGLRGVGAVMVCLLHVTLQFGIREPYNIELAFFDGQLAVFVFFYISGFVLASTYSRSEIMPTGLMIARTIRLLIPAFAACIFSLAIWLILFPKVPLGDLPNSKGNFAAIWNFIADAFVFTPLLGHGSSSLFGWVPGLGDVIRSQPNMNPALWTISVELIGSVLVIFMVKVQKKLSQSLFFLLNVLFAAFFIRSLLLPFVLGVFFYYFRPPSGWRGAGIVAGMLIVAAFLISLQASNSVTTGQTLFWAIDIAGDDYAFPAQSAFSVQKTFAAFLIFLAVMISTSIQSFLSTKPFRFLGRASFALYLTHYPLIVLLYSRKEFFLGDFSILANNTLMLAVYFSLLLVAVGIFMRVDRKAIDFSHAVGAWIMKRKKSVLAPAE